MVKRYIIEVEEVCVIKRKYFTTCDTEDEAIEAYIEGHSVEASNSYKILNTRSYEIADVYEDES